MILTPTFADILRPSEKSQALLYNILLIRLDIYRYECTNSYRRACTFYDADIRRSADRSIIRSKIGLYVCWFIFTWRIGRLACFFLLALRLAYVFRVFRWISGWFFSRSLYRRFSGSKRLGQACYYNDFGNDNWKFNYIFIRFVLVLPPGWIQNCINFRLTSIYPGRYYKDCAGSGSASCRLETHCILRLHSS